MNNDLTDLIEVNADIREFNSYIYSINEYR